MPCLGASGHLSDVHSTKKQSKKAYTIPFRGENQGPVVRTVVQSPIKLISSGLRRFTTVFLALGWIFSNQYLALKAYVDFHHTTPPFQPMIKFYVFVGFQATAVTIATVTQSTLFGITTIISKSSQTLGNETFRI